MRRASRFYMWEQLGKKGLTNTQKGPDCYNCNRSVAVTLCNFQCNIAIKELTQNRDVCSRRLAANAIKTHFHDAHTGSIFLEHFSGTFRESNTDLISAKSNKVT